jgi:DNA invertase Pin-like site-specific DNA recombinase
MDRPGLRRLLDDIQQKLVDVVVVYKVDRLTRSLSDFAKMVEIFDANGISFVAVTQQFNTTTSMGRLTLNVLLSFAQFEREVTGERIRDKIAASKRKGMRRSDLRARCLYGRNWKAREGGQTLREPDNSSRVPGSGRRRADRQWLSASGTHRGIPPQRSHATAALMGIAAPNARLLLPSLIISSTAS